MSDQSTLARTGFSEARMTTPVSARKRIVREQGATCFDRYICDVSGGQILNANDVNATECWSYMWNAITRSKTVDMIRAEVNEVKNVEIENDVELETTLPRSLSLFDLITFGVGSTVGAGVFVITGVVAADTAGPSMVLSFLIAAVSCVFSGLCYCEFATSVPVAGSAYTYAYATMGELVGFIIGWNLTLEYGISGSAVARGWAGYLVAAVESFGGHVSDDISDIDVGFTSLSPLAVFVLIACTILTVFGVKESARVNLFITCVNIFIILFIVIVGAFYVDTSNWSPFFPYGARGVMQGASRVFFSFIGFDTVSALAEEVKDPQRTLPIGIVGTLGISGALYMAVSLVVTGMVSYPNIEKDSPLSSAFSSHHVGWAASLVALGSVTTLTATTLCSLIGQPRIFMRMSQDGLFFSPFARIHPRFRTPVFGTIFTGVLSSVLAFFLDIDALADMISSGTLLAFDVVCAGVLVLHYRDAEGEHTGLHRHATYSIVSLLCGSMFTGVLFKVGVAYYIYVPVFLCFGVPSLVVLYRLPQKPSLSSAFVTPWVPFVPTIGIIVNTGLFFQLEASAMLRLIAWTLIGLIIYLTYGIRNSLLAGGGFTILAEKPR